MFGVKIYEKPIDARTTIDRWRDLGIDTAFIGPKLRHESAFLAEMRASNIDIYVIFPVFYDKLRLADHPNEYAITSGGERAIQEWVQFACPTSAEFRSHKTNELVDVIESIRPKGVTLDFTRFFVFWEKVSPRNRENLVQTCFCQRCIPRFLAGFDFQLPDGTDSVSEQAQWILTHRFAEWTVWKCAIIAETVKSLASVARNTEPAIEVGLHTVPWRLDDYNNAVQSVAGQDLSRLASYVDFLTPMCYAHMLGESAEWVHSVVEEQARIGRKPVYPSIQVARSYLEQPLTTAQLEQTLRAALQPPSHGVVFWSWEMLAKSGIKQALVRCFSS